MQNRINNFFGLKYDLGTKNGHYFLFAKCNFLLFFSVEFETYFRISDLKPIKIIFPCDIFMAVYLILTFFI